MELNTEGFYKKPRVLSGFKFLSHITETRKCGNRIPVYFPNRGAIDVIDYRLNPNDRFDCSVLFLAPLGKNDVWVEDIEEWEFVQYSPNTQWTAIKIETEEEDDMMPLVAPNDDGVEKIIFTNIDTLKFEYTTTPDGKRGYYRHIRKGNPMPETVLAPIDFQDFYIKETFDHLKEVVVLYDEQFYTVLGIRTNLVKHGNYNLYLMRRGFATVRKVKIATNQKFIYQKNSNSWLVDPVEALYTDFSDVKEQLRAEGVKKVIVAGVEKELKRVSEISTGILHLVFAYDGELEHFYSTKNTRLLVREGKIATEYLLDHVKRMHV